MNSLDLVTKQTDFTSNLEDKMENFFPNWKEVSYDCSFSAEDEEGNVVDSSFKLPHLFCLRDVYEGEGDEEAKEARHTVAKLYEGTANPMNYFYRLTHYVVRLERPLVYFAQEPVEVWEKVGDEYISMTDKHFLRFAEMLKRSHIKYVEWFEAEKIKDYNPSHLIIVDLASDAECMDIIFQKVFDYYPISHPALAYFSMVKQCDEDEMKEIASNEKKRKTDQEKKRLLKEDNESPASKRERDRMKIKEDWEAAKRERQEAREAKKRKIKEAQKALKEAQEAEKQRLKEAQEAEKQKLKEAQEAAERQHIEAEERKRKANEPIPIDYVRLSAAIKKRKADADKILQTLKEQGIECFYHFTDISNLESIKEQKGLLSRECCQIHHIVIPRPGGNSLSISLDARYNLRDYVRLSFNKTHPMVNRLQREKGYNLVWLKIKIDVALAESTLFSDMNATKTGHHRGARFEDFQKIDFTAVKTAFLTYGTPLYSKHQAEVLVKTFIPIEYIVNIDNPDRI